MTPMPVPQGDETDILLNVGAKIAGLFLAFVTGIVSTTWAVAAKFHGITAKQQDHEARLDDIEKQPVVTVGDCNLTRSGCSRAVDIQFAHGAEMFKEFREDIRDIKEILREMNR